MLFVPDELLEGSVGMLGMNESCGDLVRQQLRHMYSVSRRNVAVSREWSPGE